MPTSHLVNSKHCTPSPQPRSLTKAQEQEDTRVSEQL